MLTGDVGNRETKHEHDGVSETFNFNGESDLIIYDVRYSYKNLVLTGEYFSRTETGNLRIQTDGEDDTFGLNDVDSSGWYASAVYEINPKMRAGVRYSKLGSPDFSNANNNDLTVVGDDAVLATAHEGEFAGDDPTAIAYMIDWNHSDNSLIRFQINKEEMSNGQTDDQFIVQYIMNL